MTLVAYWDWELGAYGEWQFTSDTSHMLYDDMFTFNGNSWSWFLPVPSPGALIYKIRVEDDGFPAEDEPVEDQRGIQIVNNTYPVGSCITAGGIHLSNRELWDFLTPPLPVVRYDAGQVHFPVNAVQWVSEYRSVRSYKVNADTGASTNFWNDDGSRCGASDVTGYLYAPVDDPNTGRTYFRSTAQPGYYLHWRDHANVAPWMLTPPGNPLMFGGVCIVRGTVTIPATIPRSNGDPPATISYNVQPPQTALAGNDSVIIVVWDPTPDWPGVWYGRIWNLSAVSGNISWNGLLDEYHGDYMAESDVKFCEASTVFARITVKARDTGWNYVPVTRDVEYTFEMPRLAIADPRYNKWFRINERIPLTVIKSASVSEPLSLAQWSGGGVPAGGIGSSFATSYSVAAIHDIAAQIPNSQAAAAQARVAAMTCNFTYPAPGSDPPLSLGFTLSPAGAPLNSDRHPRVILTARDPVNHAAGHHRNYDSDAPSGTYSWDGIYYDDGYPPGTSSTRSLKDVFLSARVWLRSGWQTYDYTFDGPRVAVGADLGTYHNETETSRIATMTAYSWPSSLGGTSRSLAWTFRNEQKTVANAQSTTFSVPSTAVHTLSQTLSCLWTEYNTAGQPIYQLQGTQPIRVLFARHGLNDPDGGNPSNANWFNHYAEDHMGAIAGYWANASHLIHNTTVEYYYAGLEGGGTIAHPSYTTASVGLAGAVLDWPLQWGRDWPTSPTEIRQWITYSDFQTSGAQATSRTFSAASIPIHFTIYASSGITVDTNSAPRSGSRWRS